MTMRGRDAGVIVPLWEGVREEDSCRDSSAYENYERILGKGENQVGS